MPRLFTRNQGCIRTTCSQQCSFTKSINDSLRQYLTMDIITHARIKIIVHAVYRNRFFSCEVDEEDAIEVFGRLSEGKRVCVCKGLIEYGKIKLWNTILTFLGKWSQNIVKQTDMPTKASCQWENWGIFWMKCINTKSVSVNKRKTVIKT